ncbi:hypothetical protein BHE74_00029611 [Ensete ventricosum]|nr:hypothetical protein BHE74_00029611 [Ensete ventricosum]
MRLGTRQECVGRSLRVSGVCQDDAREFARRRSRLVGRLSGVVEKLVWRIGKFAGNTPGDYRKKTGRLATRMLEATGLAGINCPYPGVQAIEPPRSTGEPPVPEFSRYD